MSSADGTKDLGWVIDEDYPWIYHEHLGWLYHDSSGAYTDSLFFYHQTHGWLFTNESIYGFFYVLDLGQFKTMAELL